MKWYDKWYISILELARIKFEKSQIASGCNTVLIDEFKGLAKHDRKPGVICKLEKKYIQNGLGIEDAVYYYMFARTYFLRGWADDNHARVPKDAKTKGLRVESHIKTKIESYKNPKMSALVYAMPTPEFTPPEDVSDWDKHPTTWEWDFWYVTADEFLKYVNKNLTEWPDQWGNPGFGFPDYLVKKNLDPWPWHKCGNYAF